MRRIALALPETSEKPMWGMASWRVKDKLFVWERPLRQKEIDALGESAPDGPVLGARVEDEVAKTALIADEPDLYFTTPHFDGHASVLARLERIGDADLEELIVGAWLERAPEKLAQAYLADRG